MQSPFNSAGPSSQEAEKFLRDEHYNFQKRADGMIVVQGNIDIPRRGLTQLPDLSRVIVTGNFYCQENNLTSLRGAPAEVHGGFWCYGNRLESLEHTPKGITGQFICHDNRLTSLYGAPVGIQGDFTCQKNKLSSLEGAPAVFHSLKSDFGDYASWAEVPEKIRLSPENHAKHVEEQARAATVLQGKMRLSKPLRLKHP